MGIDPAAVQAWKAADEAAVMALVRIIQDIFIPMLVPDLDSTGAEGVQAGGDVRAPTMTDRQEEALTGSGR